MSLAGQWSSLEIEEATLDELVSYGLGDSVLDRLLAYCRLLQEYNTHTNLVANADLPVLLKDHLLDSLKLLRWIKQDPNKGETGAPLMSNNTTTLIDVGSGAGFPGMVIAITECTSCVTLVDSISKKCRFLESAAEKLGIANRIEVACARAELLGHDKRFREKFDFATARAVGALPMVAELCLPFLKVGGKLLAQRSQKQVKDELASANDQASRFGGVLADTVTFEKDLSGRELGLLVFEKVRATSKAYPRSTAHIKKGLLK